MLLHEFPKDKLIALILFINLQSFATHYSLAEKFVNVVCSLKGKSWRNVMQLESISFSLSLNRNIETESRIMSREIINLKEKLKSHLSM